MSQRLAVTLTTLFVALPVAAVVSPVQAQPEAGRAEFQLAPGGDGQCAVVEKTETVRVSKSRQPFVTFVVSSSCTADVVFSVDGFRHASGQGADPIQQASGQRRLRVRARQGGATMRLRVKPDAAEGEWSYNVRLDDRLVDPKLQIDP